MADLREETVKTKLRNIITKAEGAREAELKAIREELMSVIEQVGARKFVDSTAELLDEEFKIEGCNDPRVPLKKIFNISLKELEEILDGKEYSLNSDQPILDLLGEHKKDVQLIKSLKESFSRNEDEVIEKIKEYYKRVDNHILKEEEALFPRLEEKGMDEHPENLREEHQEFRAKLVNYVELLQASGDGFEEAKDGFINNFIPAMANHMFRESFIFYPATLEFISDDQEWTKIKRSFRAIDDLGSG